MILPARVTDPDGYPGVAVRVVRVSPTVAGYEVVGPDKIIRTFGRGEVSEGWPAEKSPYDFFLNGFR